MQRKLIYRKYDRTPNSNTYVNALSGNTLVNLQQPYMGIDEDKLSQVLPFKNPTLVSDFVREMK